MTTSSKQFFRTRYRIIQQINGYYQPQYRWWWLPFWVNIGDSYTDYTYNTLSGAEKAIELHRNPIVKEYD